MAQGAAVQRYAGADVDDLPLARPFHVGNHRPGGQKRPREIHRDDPMPVGHVGLLDGNPWRVAHDAGVVHQDVDAAEVVEGLLCALQGLLLRGHVHLHRQRLAPLRRHQPGGPLDAREVHVGGADVGAFRRQPHRIRPAQARGRAGNQGNAILKSHGSAPSAPFPGCTGPEPPPAASRPVSGPSTRRRSHAAVPARSGIS